MTLLPISVLGAPILRVETTPVASITDQLQRVIDEMFETMYAAQGIGLAAPQVGRSERLALVDVGDNPIVIINPEIVREDGSERAEEGCLSIPDIYGDVDRAKHVVVRALDREGNPFEIDATDLLARCLQHEIDHLHGRLFIDYLSFLKRRSALSKWDGIKGRYPTLLRHLTPEELREARAERARHPDEQI